MNKVIYTGLYNVINNNYPLTHLTGGKLATG